MVKKTLYQNLKKKFVLFESLLFQTKIELIKLLLKSNIVVSSSEK